MNTIGFRLVFACVAFVFVIGGCRGKGTTQEGDDAGSPQAGIAQQASERPSTRHSDSNCTAVIGDIEFCCPEGAEVRREATLTGPQLWCEEKGQKQGKETLFFQSGQKHVQGEYQKGQSHGTWTAWNETGGKTSETEFRNGNKHGKEILYHDNGQKKVQAEYERGKPHGRMIMWYENGQKEAEGEWRNGRPLGEPTFWNKEGHKLSEVEYKDYVARGRP